MAQFWIKRWTGNDPHWYLLPHGHDHYHVVRKLSCRIIGGAQQRFTVEIKNEYQVIITELRLERQTLATAKKKAILELQAISRKITDVGR